MAKAARKKPAKTTKKSSGGTAAKISATNQPQSKAQAAAAAGVFLHTDDAWSLAYFDPNDLHNLERKLFG
jgi:hypothetical protein